MKLANIIRSLCRVAVLASTILAAQPFVVPDLAPALAIDFVTFGSSKLEIVGAHGGSHPFTVELAVTPAQLQRGLMYRPSLAEDAGMLFDMGRTQPTRFWMKNTVIPLDMIFIAEDGRIVAIVENTIPLSLDPVGPNEPVRAVLEVKGGLTARLGIKPGDLIRHSLFNNA